MPCKLAQADEGNGVALSWPWIGVATLDREARATMPTIRIRSVLTVINLAIEDLIVRTVGLKNANKR